MEGNRSVLKRIYSCEAYYERVKIYLRRTQPTRNERQRGERQTRQRWMTRGNARAFVTCIIRLGVFGRQRWTYWKFLSTVATRYPHCVGTAMTLAVMGYHFQVMTDRLTGVVDSVKLPKGVRESLSR